MDDAGGDLSWVVLRADDTPELAICRARVRHRLHESHQSNTVTEPDVGARAPKSCVPGPLSKALDARRCTHLDSKRGVRENARRRSSGQR